jgi:hypothetical protein
VRDHFSLECGKDLCKRKVIATDGGESFVSWFVGRLESVEEARYMGHHTKRCAGLRSLEPRVVRAVENGGRAFGKEVGELNNFKESC